MPLLTAREVEVLQHILAGRTDPAIAALLGVSPKTVNFHVENAKRKLGTGQRVQAILTAVRRGFLSLPADGDRQDRELEVDDTRRARPRPSNRQDDMPRPFGRHAMMRDAFTQPAASCSART